MSFQLRGSYDLGSQNHGEQNSRKFENWRELEGQSELNGWRVEPAREGARQHGDQGRTGHQYRGQPDHDRARDWLRETR
jgi:hypothetical protein